MEGSPDLLSLLISVEEIPWPVSDYQCYIIKHGFGKRSLFSWASNNWFQHTTVVVQLLSHVWLFATPWTAAGQASMSFTIPELAQTHVHWVSDAIQPSHPLLALPVSACLQSFPASGSFPMSPLFASGGQSIGASASVLPMNIQGWFPLGLTGLISLQSKGLSRVFSNTTVKKYQFFGIQPSLWSYLRSSHISLLGSRSITGQPWENLCCNVSVHFFSFHNQLLFIVF